MARKRNGESQDARWERIKNTRLELRKLPKVEWWIWQITETSQYTHRGIRAATCMLGWPYLLPEMIDEAWLFGSLDHSPISNYFGNRHETAQAQTYGQLTRKLNNLGKMFAVRYELFGRSAMQFLITPPVWKFIDLDKVFPDVSEVIKPYAFWIQPDVFAQTGELLHGAPWARENVYERGVTPRVVHTFEDPAFTRELEEIKVALDAWLVRYETTGRTDIDPAFGWTFAEERAQREAALNRTCDHVDEHGARCRRPVAYRFGLRSMRSWSGVLCANHADELNREHPATYRFDPLA